MSKAKLEVSESDWERVLSNSDDAPIPFAPEDGPYDPNDADAARAYLDSCKVTSGGRVVRTAASAGVSTK
jgi:hypothetical protein